MTASVRLGFVRSKFLTRIMVAKRSWRCLRPIGRRRRAWCRACRFAFRSLCLPVRGSGERAGFFANWGTSWEHVLEVLCAYRLICPGSEWRLHRHWYAHSAMGDLLGEDDALGAKDTLYRALDLLLAHKPALFDHLTARWGDLFGV